eukprot:jgi/Bigna1/147443/aug1.159_g22151
MRQTPHQQHADAELNGIIAVDTIGPVEGTKHCIQTLCAMAVGCIHARAVKRISSAKTADFVMTCILQHGCPEKILVDQGPENAGNVMSHLQNGLRPKFLKMSAENSQGNSVLGRKPRATNDGIVAVLLQNLDDAKNWHRHLDMVALGVNATTDENGHSPARLSLGHQPRFLADMNAESLGAPASRMWFSWMNVSRA